MFKVRVHVRNLHREGGGKFAHRVKIWSCERCLRICSRVQILHPGANCAHERKPYIFIHFEWRFR